MPRVKRGTQHVKRRKNILARTKGMMWGRKSKLKLAKIAAVKAGKNAYVGRKLKKRENRGLQQMRIGAASRELGVSYSKLMGDLKKRDISLNRVVLSEIAAKHPNIFAKIAKG
ncbi:MAG: 50S ribosomal protein L20 [Candidatus Magasanikbacteria bacterium]|nr:50S ribosomal protein L20 [Candidatus Magasanikbacteria bacterium]MCA9390756.1 50S ribosomal protein L20 [Candidatus Magasanikbacteria bacterium]USN52257.1 MAG: 50S ribosomal protein L20 [Candidatus Nomurabacteria bacterium]HPF95201.1 50S ribosomal protein L20 [bacterium]